MNKRSLPIEAFRGLPVEHCPLCGELISIDKSEIIQLSDKHCNFCKNDIMAYLPKHEEQLFFTKECNNCRKMNNTRSQYCVFCGLDFSKVKIWKVPDIIPKLVAYLSLGLAISGFLIIISLEAYLFVVLLNSGVLLIFSRVSIVLFFVGISTLSLGDTLSVIMLFNQNTKKIARNSLIISGSISLIVILFLPAFFFI